MRMDAYLEGKIVVVADNHRRAEFTTERRARKSCRNRPGQPGVAIIPWNRHCLRLITPDCRGDPGKDLMIDRLNSLLKIVGWVHLLIDADLRGPAIVVVVPWTISKRGLDIFRKGPCELVDVLDGDSM